MKIDREILSQIIQDCYWDYNIDIKKLENILKKRDKRDLQKLFYKIMYNAKDPLKALSIFTKDELQEFFKNFKITYNKKFMQRRYQILNYLLFGKKSYIKGLEWVKK